jgi:archaeal flagellar protein FlaJ
MSEKIDQKIEELKELAERIRIIYNPPREYFTIVLPVILAILLLLGAVFMGYTFHGTQKQQQQGDSVKLQQLKEMEAQMNEEGGGASAANTTTPEMPPAAPKMGLDEIMVFAVLISISPYAIDITLQKRSTRRKEELYTEFLFKLSELMRGGLDPIKSVKELSKTDLGILTPHVRIASTSMIYGKSFEESMKSMAKSLHSELITRYTTLVIQASYSGGSVADLILKASEDMRSIISIEREKEGNLSQYVMIFYFAQGIIVFIIYTLSTSLLPFVEQLGSTSIFGGTNQLASLDFNRGFFHMIMINSFFGGLIIGKISEGDARYGLKHAVVLMTFGYIACAMFILPPPSAPASQAFNITSISGNTTLSGVVGLPLKDQIQFKLTDSSGNPVNNTLVQFSIIPEGNVTPPSDMSDKNGIVGVRIVLGNSAGNYVVFAKANGNSGKVNVIAKSS